MSFIDRFNLKSPVVYIGAIGVVVVVYLASRAKGGGGGSSAQEQYMSAQAANAANQLSLAQINAQTEQQRISAGVATLNATLGSQTSLAGVEAQRAVALAKIASDENLGLQESTYGYDLQNKSLENQRVLGLTAEDTKRLLGQDALNTQRYISEMTLNSAERLQLQEFGFREKELESNERIQDFISLRGLSYAQIQGANQIGAIKASKPSAWSTFLGSLGGGLGRGLTSFLGGL